MAMAGLCHGDSAFPFANNALRLCRRWQVSLLQNPPPIRREMQVKRDIYLGLDIALPHQLSPSLVLLNPSPKAGSTRIDEAKRAWGY